MTVLAECPGCRRLQSVKNTQCKCGVDLAKAKKLKNKVKYYIGFRIPGSRKLHRELVGFSYKKAAAADGKRKVQKAENRILDMIPESDITFEELSDWYQELESVKALAMAGVIGRHMAIFNEDFGTLRVNQLKPSSLKNFQAKMKTEGRSPSYIDQIIGSVRTMVIKAFDDDMISGDCMRPFKKVPKLLKRNANARDKVISHAEFGLLMDKAPKHIKPIIAMGYYTGMRLGEILGLTWGKVYLRDRMIRLSPLDTKDDEQRNIPILDPLHDILKDIPRAIHDDHVFLYRGNPLTDIRSGFKHACKNAGIPYGRKVKGGLTFHDLRHTFNTNARKAGLPEKLIMQTTGHSTREMFDRYNTITPDEVAGINSALLNHLVQYKEAKTEI